MNVLVIGTPDSGKSSLAENIICTLSSENDRYYLATMIAYDEEGENRIAKHRKFRDGKGFITIEQPYNIPLAFKKIKDLNKKSVLLECISNLVGNELYENPLFKQNESTDRRINRIAEKIYNDIVWLANKVDNLVIVTNEFEIKEDYDNDTVDYINAVNMVNEKLSHFVDRVEKIKG